MKKLPVLRAILPFALSLLAGSVIASNAAPGAAPTPPAAPAKTERNCHLPGVIETLRCVKIQVPLDHAKPNGEQITLHVTKAPALKPGTRNDPLFVLAGGPGQAGTDVLPLLDMAFDRVRATRDIVFIDQRGTGLSGKLDCPTKPEHERMNEAGLRDALIDCIGASKASFAAYTTAAAAADLELVRKAMGYAKVNVWGGSYGTRLAQAYARAYPASVRALVLDGVAPPEQVIPAGGRDSETALNALFDQCAKDKACSKAFPTLRADFDALTAKVQSGVRVKVADPRTAEPLEFQMTAQRFFGTIHSTLYSPADARRLPFLIHSAARGRWEPFIARQNVVSDFGTEAGLALLMHLAVVCAEDVPHLTPELLKSDTTMLTRANVELMPAACKHMKVPAAPKLSNSRIEQPALLLSGALDPVTPPHRAATAARAMAKAQQIVVDNAGHGVSQLGCGPRLLRTFLEQPDQKLDASCMAEVPAPTFQLGNAGPQP